MALKRLLLATAGLAAWLSFPAAAAQAIPNFTPVPGAAWLAGDPKGKTPTGQDYLQPESGPGPVTNDPAHPFTDDAASRRDGTQPTWRVADLTNPILLPWTREALRKQNERVLTGGGIPFTPKERCWPIGVPAWVLYPVRPVFFMQLPKEVVLLWDEDHQTRHIYLDTPHSAHPKPSWFGESVGHYEGTDTLVVDTIGLNARTFVDSYRTPHTDQMHVIERYRMAADGKSMEVSVHVEDPGAFTTPWNARQHYNRVTDGMRDQTCAENNSDWFGYPVEPIPQSARADF